MSAGTPALQVDQLSVRLRGGTDILKGVDVQVDPGGITAVVGGSGSGKTTLGLAVLGLIPPAMEHAGGRVRVDGVDMAGLSLEALRRARGGRVGMVFQEPLSAFNPLMSVGAQIAETLDAHEVLTAPARRERVRAALDAAGISDPARVAAAYPHELSGGLRQRAMVAQAVVCRPRLLIADEPTSSLDMVNQEKVLDLFRGLCRWMGLGVLLITHDLGVVRRVADRMVVLQSGRVVEEGTVRDVMAAPASAYTRALLAAEL